MAELIKRYLHKAPFQLDAFSVDFPGGVEPGQNRAPFQGILTRLNEPSTRPPNGSNGHRVMIPSAVAQAALPSLVGMPINCSITLKDHDKKFVIGNLDRGEIVGNDLVVYGTLFDKNFPDEVEEIRARKAQLGMSYEISGVEVENTSAPVWTLTHLVFTGAAILQKDAAAYSKTAIAAQAALEEEWPMAAVDTVLNKIEELGTKLDILARKDDDDDDDEEARKHEEEAKRHEDEARRHEEDAARARDDDDEEDAKRHEEEAASKFSAAAKCREEARKRHEEAARKRREEGDEEAAKRHDEEARRMKDEEAAYARHRDEEAARGKDDDDDDDDMAGMLAMFLRGMGYAKKMDGKGRKEDDEEAYGKHISRLKKLFDAMTYPGSSPRARRAQDAQHDDEEEDTKLFRKLIQQYRGDDSSMDASRERRTLNRRLRTIEASMEMLTDNVSKMAKLITDTVATQRDLITNVSRGTQGGPVRRTMAAGGEAWLSKQSAGPAGAQVMSLSEQEAALKGMDAQARIAQKFTWQSQGITLADQ